MHLVRLLNPTAAQAELCRRHDVEPQAPLPDHRLGFAGALLERRLPVHGLRHRPAADMCGWYIWAGDAFPAEAEWRSLHVSHLAGICAPAVPYLALPPGWRFLIAPGHSDVWFDATLLDAPDSPGSRGHAAP